MVFVAEKVCYCSPDKIGNETHTYWRSSTDHKSFDKHALLAVVAVVYAHAPNFSATKLFHQNELEALVLAVWKFSSLVNSVEVHIYPFMSHTLWPCHFKNMLLEYSSFINSRTTVWYNVNSGMIAPYKASLECVCVLGGCTLLLCMIPSYTRLIEPSFTLNTL